MNNNIQSKLIDIAQCIFNRIDGNKKLDSAGLLSGDWGLLLFIFHYSRFSKNKQWYKLADDYLELLLDQLGDRIRLHTYCRGLSGILYLFEFLKDNDFTEVDISEYEEVLENYLIHRMENDIKNNNYDFLHGAIGVGLYFLKRNKQEPVLKIIDFLYNTAEYDKKSDGLKWKSIIDSEENLIGYNICLSHGMAGIVLFLSRAIKQDIIHKEIYDLLTKSINYILAQKIDFSRYGSFFPNFSKESSNPINRSRLAWCYGDLGVAYSIWYAGKITKNKIWEKEGLNLLLSSCQRKQGGIIDAGICHGSTGLVMIYRHMFIETQNYTFRIAYEYWLDKTLEMAVFEMAYLFLKLIGRMGGH